MNDCIPEDLTHDALIDLCGPIPCAWAKDIPTIAEADELAGGLSFRGEVSSATRRENLLQCGWALLVDNLDLVEWVLCMLTADPNAVIGGGNCIINRIQNQNLDVRHIDKPDSRYAMVTVPTVRPWGVGWRIKVNWGHGYMDSAWRLWTSGDESMRACACLAAAEILLHEIAHTCLRDALDNLFDRHCPFNDLLENSFAYAAMQRYQAARNACACDKFQRESTWYKEGVTTFMHKTPGGRTKCVP